MSYSKLYVAGLVVCGGFIGCSSGEGTPGTTTSDDTSGNLSSGGASVSGSSGGHSSGGVAESVGSGGRDNAATGGRNMSGGTGGDPSNPGGGASSGGAAADTGGSDPGEGCAVPAPTEYPNLFVTLSGHTQEETDAKLEAAWNQLYNPSNANTVYYDGPGSDESYVKDVANNDVRTEGMSYGMMTSVQLDHQEQFDRLWNWVKKHMAQGTTGEIAWQASTGGSKMSSGGAPDGEEYFATALIFAQNRWGNSTGKFDYGVEAQWVLDLIRTQYFNSGAHIIQFVKNSGNTDASYILPAFYQVWACFDTANAPFWDSAVTAGRELFHAAADGNGVIGDRQSFTGQTQQGAGSDAKRCVMNIMMDHNFFNADPWQVDTYATKFGAYMSSRGNGAAEFSCNALLGFGLPAASGKPFVDKLWTAPIPTGQYRYYDGTLYMLGLLHVSGKFKLWY